MKITIYELLGLVKEGKAPKEIRYDDTIYEYSEVNDFYYCNGFSLYRDFAANGNCLNDEVEIIEEPKKIKKIEMYQDEEGHYFLNKQGRKVYVNCDEIDFMVDKFNELIDEINNLKEK